MLVTSFTSSIGRKLVIRQLRRGLQFHEEGFRRHLESLLGDHWNPGWRGSLCGICAVQLGHEQRMNKEIELREDLSPRKYASYSLVPPIVWSGHLYEHVTCLRIMQQPSGSVHYTNPPN